MPRLRACGSNSTGLLSLNHCNDVSTFQDITFHPSLDDVLGVKYRILDLSSASTHSLLLVETDKGETLVLGAGLNTLGQLGSRCALWDDVKVVGRFKLVNLLGDLGLSHADWKPVKIAVTWTTSFVVYERVLKNLPRSADAQTATQGAIQMVLSCGSNDFGELGLPTAENDSAKVPVTTPSPKPTIVDLGLVTGEKVEMIRCGQRHILVLINGKDGQRIMGWGAARKGELNPTMKSDTSRKGKGKGVAQASILPPTQIIVPGLSDNKVIDMVLGSSHTVILMDNGRVIAWGSDGKGQIAGLSDVQGVRAIAATWNGTYLLTDRGLWTQGSNSHSQLLRPDNRAGDGGFVGALGSGWTVEKLVTGTEHVLILATDDNKRALWVGGWNEHGNLGIGDQVDRDRLTKVDIVGKVLAAWGGCAVSWISVDSE